MAEPVLIRPLGRENLREEPQLEFSVIKEFIKFKENQSPTPSTPPSLNGGIIVGENLIFRRLLLLDQLTEDGPAFQINFPGPSF